MRACILLLSISVCSAQSSEQRPDKEVPTVDGGAGICSLALTLNTADGKPVYAAKVKVHIAYGFGGFRKLDLEASTNSDGKVKFTGLPDRVRRPPLEFEATKDDLGATAKYDPSAQCRAYQSLVLEKAKSEDNP